MPSTSWSTKPTRPRVVRYLADTPRIMRGVSSISCSWALSAFTFAAFPLSCLRDFFPFASPSENLWGRRSGRGEMR